MGHATVSATQGSVIFCCKDIKDLKINKSKISKK